MTDTTTDTAAAVRDTAEALEELAAHRTAERELLRKVRELYVVTWHTGLPKTGPNGVAAVIRTEMGRRGWSDKQLQGLGCSGFNVRQVLDHA